MYNVRWAIIFSLIFSNFSTRADELMPSEFNPAPPTINSIRAGGPRANEKCGPSEKTEISPFMISKLLKNIDEQKKTNHPQMTSSIGDGGHIPAMTIVRMTGNPATFNSANDKDFVPIQVISVPGGQAIDEMKTGPKKLARAVAGELANPNDVGHIPKGLLSKLDDYVFSVKEDTSLFKFPPAIEAQLKHSVVRFADPDGRYTTHTCCQVDSSTQQKNDCHTDYEFQIVDEANPQNIIANAFDDTNCSFMSQLYPIPKNLLQSLVQLKNQVTPMMPDFSLDQFRFFDTRGYAKIPLLDSPPKDSPLKAVDGMSYGPAQSMHYNTTSSYRKDQNDNNTYAHPTSACAFFHAVEAYNQKCHQPGCIVQWGDWYNSNNVSSSHKGHNSGSCVDVRPMSKVEDYDGLVFGSCPLSAKAPPKVTSDTESATPKKKTRKQGACYYNKNYDQEMTKTFISYMQAAGGVGSTKDGYIFSEPIFFNDTAGIQDVKHLAGHSNHIHVCFPPNEPQVQKTCNEGFTQK